MAGAPPVQFVTIGGRVIPLHESTGGFNTPGQGGGFHSHESGQEHEEARQFAAEKIKNAPVPSEAAVTKARAELAAAQRGEGRAGGEARGGSAADRRRQRQNLFREQGGEERGHICCHGCGIKMHWADPGSPDNPEGHARFERGKIFVKAQGGGYQLPNLLAECFACNRSRNDQLLRPENAPETP